METYALGPISQSVCPSLEPSLAIYTANFSLQELTAQTNCSYQT